MEAFTTMISPKIRKSTKRADFCRSQGDIDLAAEAISDLSHMLRAAL